MPSQVLTFLKYLFLVVLYLFFVRVVRAVWTELREPAPGSVPMVAAPVPVASPRQRRAQRAEAPPDRLQIVEPPDRAGQRFDLGTELTVGRASGCGVSLPDDTFVSQLHARVFHRADGYLVEDLGSTNGTFLNEVKVSAPVPLHRGDRLKVGRTIMELVG